MNSDFKLFYSNLKEGLSNMKILLFFSLLSLLIFFLFTLISNYELIKGNLGITYLSLEISLQIIISILISTFISFSYYKFKKFKIVGKKDASISTLGSFLGVLVIGCSACSITIASYIGLAGIISTLPWLGLELKLLGIILLLYSNYSLIKNLNVCAIK